MAERQGTRNDASKGWLGGLIRVGLSILFLAVILRFIPAGEVWACMRQVSAALWCAVFIAFLAGHVVAAAKWRALIGGAIPFGSALKAHFAGLAANLMLPGVAGGDIVRAGIVMRGSSQKTALAVGSLADRLIDTGALVLIAAGGAIWLGASAGADRSLLATAAAIVVALAAAGIWLAGPVARLMRATARDGKAGRVLSNVGDALEEMSHRKATLIGCVTLSIMIQTSFALLNVLIAQSLGVGVSLAAWVFAWPLAKLVATLPISFGGLGVREASLAGLMAPLGAPSAGVIAASLVWQTILYAGGAVGALAQAAGRRRTAGAAHG